MQKIEFKNYPDTTTPLSADNLNAIQNNTESAISTAITDLITFDAIQDIKGNIKIGNIGVEWGVVSVAPTSGSSPNYYGTTVVNFEYTYSYAPLMLANLGAGYTSVTNVATLSVGNTSGSVWMTASSQTARNCRYLVIGKIEQNQ